MIPVDRFPHPLTRGQALVAPDTRTFLPPGCAESRGEVWTGHPTLSRQLVEWTGLPLSQTPVTGGFLQSGRARKWPAG